MLEFFTNGCIQMEKYDKREWVGWKQTWGISRLRICWLRFFGEKQAHWFRIVEADKGW